MAFGSKSHAAAIMKWIVTAFALCLSTCLQGGQLILVHFEYGGAGPQGSYLLASGKDGLVPLGSIENGKKLPSVKADGIVAALEKAYPGSAGMITSSEVRIDIEKLTASGKVQVFGQVANAGEHPAALLKDYMAVAAPDPFAAVSRIQVIRKRSKFIYDLRNNNHASTKLEPGDIVLVPARHVIGN